LTSWRGTVAIAALCDCMLLVAGGAGAAGVDRPGPDSIATIGDTNLVPADELPPPPDQPANPVEFVIDRDASGDRYLASELLVTYSASVSRSTIREATEDLGAEVEVRLEEIDARLLEFPEIQEMGSSDQRERALREAKQQLAASPGVEHAGYNYLLHTAATFNDPLQGFQWALGQIGASAAWDVSVGSGTRIAILDSGLDWDPFNPNGAPTHPEFQGAVVASGEYFSFTPFDGIPEDNNGHGTHVAGIASANTNNGFGIAGTSPNSGLIIAKVCEGLPREGAPCDLAAGAQALIDVANVPGGVDAANLSFGGTASDPALENAVNYATGKGVLVVAAAGNNASTAPFYPAAYPNAFAVSSTNIQDGISAFSNTGSYVDISAPGGDQGAAEENIFATYPQFLGSFEFLAGTSQAAPHVTGTAALLAAQGMNAKQIRDRLQDTATDLGPCGTDTGYGAGRLDAGAALGATAPTANCLGPPVADDDCDKAKRKLRKAKRRFRNAKETGDPQKVRKALQRLRKARKRYKEACKPGT
jgi:thermitase